MDQEIYIIRHGETDYNKKRIIQGRGVNSDINELGRRQAQAFHDHYGHIGFDQIFTSCLKRTQQTVQPFVDAGHNYYAHPGLDEIDWGIHEGKTGDTSLSKEYIHIIKGWGSGQLDIKIPGGESPLEIQLRQKMFIEEHLAERTGKILMATHGRAIRVLLCTMLGIELSRMDEFQHVNLALYKLHRIGGKYELILRNDTAHLKNI